ncbi:MAG: NAD(P)H-hydrate epimerase [Caldilineaceae bacterium]
MSNTPIPALTTAQMQEVDRLMVEEYHIELLQMMENAGRNLAVLATRLLDDDIADRPIVVLAGRGNNGGGGLVAARHLLNWGAWVQVVTSYAPDGYKGVPRHQLDILSAWETPLAWAEEGYPGCAVRPAHRRGDRLRPAAAIRGGAGS